MQKVSTLSISHIVLLLLLLLVQKKELFVKKMLFYKQWSYGHHNLAPPEELDASAVIAQVFFHLI
jgi:hypothetical protein